MMKRLTTLVLLSVGSIAAYAQNDMFSIGLHAGAVVGDYRDAYPINAGLDISYLRSFSDKFYVGAAASFTNYFSESFSEGGRTTEFDDRQLLPLAGSIRISPLSFRSILVGADIGYAIGLNDENGGGFYTSPRLTYLLSDFQLYAGYRLVALEGDDLTSVQVGVSYVLR